MQTNSCYRNNNVSSCTFLAPSCVCDHLLPISSGTHLTLCPHYCCTFTLNEDQALTHPRSRYLQPPVPPHQLVSHRHPPLPPQCLSTHLEVLQHMLKESRVPLAWERVTDVWSALLDNPDACADDRTVCRRWGGGGWWGRGSQRMGSTGRVIL